MRRFATEAALTEALNQELGRSFRVWQKQKQEQGTSFRLGLSGGSVLSYLRPEKWVASTADLAAWQVYPIDERYVPLAHPDSNAGQILRIFQKTFSESGPKTPIAPPWMTSRKHPEGASRHSALPLYPWPTHLPLAEAAAQYEKLLRDWGEQKREKKQSRQEGHKQHHKEGDAFFPKGFDFLLLGAGPDGHIASLFPGHPCLQKSKSPVVYLEDSPKPPLRRLSLSLPFLQASRRGILLLTKVSSDKAGLYQRLSAFLDARRDLRAKRDSKKDSKEDCKKDCKKNSKGHSQKEAKEEAKRKAPPLANRKPQERKTLLPNKAPSQQGKNAALQDALLPAELLLKGMGERLEIWTLP